MFPHIAWKMLNFHPKVCISGHKYLICNYRYSSKEILYPFWDKLSRLTSEHSIWFPINHIANMATCMAWSE